MKTCRCLHCSSEYSVQDDDFKMYSRFDVPLPTWCPDCRQMRRVRHLNELNLFKRNCGATGKPLITHHPHYVPYPVYSQKYWYSDAVDNTAVGRAFDFSKSFFEQYQSLSNVVSRPALFTDFARDENSEYTNYSGKNKSCYLIFDSDENWDCMYSYSLNSSKNTLDCYRGDKLELCYQAVDCQNCYACSFLQNCSECSNSAYLKNCIGVKDSLFCANLKQKSCYLFNQPSTPEEIQALRLKIKSPTELRSCFETFQKLIASLPERAWEGLRSENSIGNYLFACKDAYHCFDCRNVWDGRYIYQAFMSVKNSMDCNEIGQAELLYECSVVGYNAYNCRFCLNCLNQITNCTYCDMCFLGCSDLFGCIGLKRRSFCILNQQYNEHEYNALLPKIIAHMKETGEWGQFFPVHLSPFAYNHSNAQIFYPLHKEEASILGIEWAEEDAISERSEASADRRGDTCSCRSCKKDFRITPQEREFYSTFGINPPENCFLCRHGKRMNSRASRMLFASRCTKCDAGMQGQVLKVGSGLFCESCFAESYL